MNITSKIRWCILVNLTLLFITVSTVVAFASDKSDYLKCGPSDSLQVMGVQINTWTKYMLLQIFICFTQIVNVIISEIANPILGFNIYNPDKKVITEFGKLELQMYANAMWIISGIKHTVDIIIAITQIDIAILKVIYGELASFYTIRMLLNEKTFTTNEEVGQGEELTELIKSTSIDANNIV